ncbi:hypothetical protein ACWO4B_003236 [Clostridium sporogenes]
MEIKYNNNNSNIYAEKQKYEKVNDMEIKGKETIQEEKPKSSNKRKSKDKFTKITDKIILKKGLKPKEFDQQAIRKERQKLYDEFVSENIESLL